MRSPSRCFQSLLWTVLGMGVHVVKALTEPFCASTRGHLVWPRVSWRFQPYPFLCTSQTSFNHVLVVVSLVPGHCPFGRPLERLLLRVDVRGASWGLGKVRHVPGTPLPLGFIFPQPSASPLPASLHLGKEREIHRTPRRCGSKNKHSCIFYNIRALLGKGHVHDLVRLLSSRVVLRLKGFVFSLRLEFTK